MEFLKRLSLWQKRGVSAFLGGIGGYAYYYYIGCLSGTCAITSSPYISTMYGMAIAILLVKPSNMKERKDKHGINNSATDKKI